MTSLSQIMLQNIPNQHMFFFFSTGRSSDEWGGETLKPRCGYVPKVLSTQDTTLAALHDFEDEQSLHLLCPIQDLTKGS